VTNRALGQSFCIALSVALSLASLTAPAYAQGEPDVRASASEFFDAGAQAYESGQYLVAAEAFLKAHERMSSPSLLFSAAQAYRRHYLAENSLESLRRAITLYRDYLRADPQAKRREDAMRALEELIPLEARLSGAAGSPLSVAPGDGSGGAAGSGVSGAAPSAPSKEQEGGTRLLLTARSEGAEVSVDGAPFRTTPAVVKVTPGPHHVRVRAPGYFEEQLTVQAVVNELIPRHVPLRPMPARLRVAGTSGARVLVDGQLRATVPTEAAIALDPGAHFVAVTRTGHEPYSKVIELRRDGSTDLTVHLPRTSQRIAAFGVLSAGAAGAIVSGVLTGLALARQGEAVQLSEQLKVGTLVREERDRYNLAVASRDDFALAASLTGGIAGLTLLTGVGLFVFDEPEVLPPSDDPRKAPSKSAPRADFELGLLSLRARVHF
jgi:hypothetical protein